MYWYDGKLINSQQIQLDLDEPGLCYGASVFTTMRVYERSLCHHLTCWQAHCNRLNSSIQAFNWFQPDWQRLKRGAKQLSTHYPILRIAIFPSGKEWIVGRNLPKDLKQRQEKGITAWVAEDEIYTRELAKHKSGNYLGAYLARDRAFSFNAQEAILTDSQGNWLETSTGNLWGWQDGSWYTPSLDSRILPGIKRSSLLYFLHQNNITVRENIWSAKFVSRLEAIFYSNCIVNIIPITKILKLGCIIEYPIIRLEDLSLK